MMPRAIVSVREAVSPESPPMATPAEKNAKIGTATMVEIKPHRSAKCGGETLIHRFAVGCGADLGAGACGGADRDGEPEQHTGDGGVHARGVNQPPHQQRQRDEQPPGADAAVHRESEQASGTSARPSMTKSRSSV